jgi:hypothetical protein
MNTISSSDLLLEAEIYSPNVDDNGMYIDKIPPVSTLKNGIRCPCGTRQDKSYNTVVKFSAHIKTKRHQEWISNLSKNKLNYYEENVKLKDTIHNQRLIIASLEKSINNKNLTIEFLTQQLNEKSPIVHMQNQNHQIYHNLIDL